MATYTDNYNLVKPTMAESADIRTINGNMDSVDNIMHATQVSLANAYDQNETYNTGDIVMYQFLMYECLDDEVTGTWDATKWQRTTAGEHGGGSNVSITPTLQSGTKIADFEIDGVQGELYAPTGGGEGGVYIEEVIFDTYTTSNGTYALNNSIDNYDALLICGYGYAADDPTTMLVSQFVTKAEFDKYFALIATVTGQTRRATINFPDANHVTVSSIEGSIALKYIYGLKMSGNFFTPQIYSLEEREVGVWIDGKPLYQKSFTGTLTSTLTTLSISDLGIDELIKWEVMVNGSYDNNPFKAYLSTNVDSDKVNTTFYNGDMRIHTSSFWVGSGYFATIFYTKTTDTAGSGNWTPSGVPAHYYSTEEQVVGTWIDGSTVYEKIFDLGSDVTYSAGWHTLDIPKGNINRIFDGLFISDAGVSCDVGLACNDTTYLEILVYSGTSQVVGRYIKARYTKSTT